MATRYYLDGAEVVGKIRNAGDNAPGGGLEGLTSSAQGGDFGSGGVVIDDIAGALDIVGWRPFYVEEDEATPSRIFTGFVGGRAISQSDIFEAPGVARVWDCDIMDLNVILGLKIFRTAAAKRPAETDLVRIAWMLANWPAPDWPVYDNGGVGAINDRNFDEADLRNEFPEEVLANLAIDVRQFFLYWDETAVAGEEISLWYNYPTSVRGTLAVKLSNNPADINASTVFAALNGQSVSRDPAFTYSGLVMKYRNGSFYQRNSTTATTYIDRDMKYETDRIGLLSTAQSRATQILDRASTEKDTVTCTVILLNADVNKIKEGYRIEAKFTHLPGYTSYTLVTIQMRTLRRPDNGATDRWEVDLELSNQAPGSGGGEGGGDPGDFPHVPVSPSIVQQVSGAGSSTPGAGLIFAADPTEGNTIVAVTTGRGTYAWDYASAGYTLGPSGETVTGGTDRINVVYKVVAAGEPRRPVNLVNSDINGTLFELPGIWTPATHAEGAGVTGGLSVAAISVPANSINFLVAANGSGGGYDAVAASQSYLIGGGFTEVYDAPNGSGGHPSTLTGRRIDTTATTVTGAATVTFSDKWGMQVVSFTGTASDSPPTPGQPVGPETVVMVGAVGTTAYPYANGSLKVTVDGVSISSASITETDPAAGTFTLAWAPDADETVKVTYLGR